MVRAIKEQVIIRPGGLIEIRHPDLPPGMTVEVIVMIEESRETKPPDRLFPLSSLFGAVRGCFGSGEEADSFIRAERDAWER